MNTCVENMRTLSLTQIRCLVAFSSKERRVLAAHPLSLSSSEGVWLVRKGEKVRENEKRQELLKASRLTVINDPKSLYKVKKMSPVTV